MSGNDYKNTIQDLRDTPLLISLLLAPGIACSRTRKKLMTSKNISNQVRALLLETSISFDRGL